MKKAVMYGGGNIGRGFIGALLSQSGYEVTFIDVAEPVVKALQEKRTYPVRYVSSEGHKDVWIENVTAVNGNLPEAVDAIAECDIMATAVGARILKFIVPNIVAGLRKRWAMGKGALNIIICENLMDANKVLEGMLKEQLTAEEQAKFDASVGLVEASIGRMVPVQTEEMKDGEPMRVCVESYGFLPVDKAAFVGGVPEIRNMVPYEPFDFYIKRKLYVHNMGHATCAYLGDQLGLQYIYEAIAVPEVRILVQNAMLESAMALSKKYGADLMALQLHITDLLYRFTNAALKDTCQRVGGDPARKLSPEDRLIGSSKLALEQGVTPAYIAVGAAAGLHRYIKEAESLEQGIDTATKVLSEVAGLAAEDTLAKLILEYYQMLLGGCSLAQLCTKAELVKHAGMNNVI
ncbi:MAG: mannitol dehydrogenase [Oscillospiraceae bacterium]|nr:mannitol dehydrogenase [Oscillospiraceae bacterium]